MDVNSFIIEQIRIIEFCPLNIIVLTIRSLTTLCLIKSNARGTGIYEAVFSPSVACGKAVKGLNTVSWVGLEYVIVVFLDHTHLLFVDKSRISLDIEADIHFFYLC